MNLNNVWLWVVVGLYSLIVLICLYGFHLIRQKELQLHEAGTYQERRSVIRWKYRFLFFTLCASGMRIVVLSFANIHNESLKLARTDDFKTWTYQPFNSIVECLFFSSFNFIVWFFAKMTFQQSSSFIPSTSWITAFFFALNIALYVSQLILIICSGATHKWSLQFYIGNIITAICDLFLGISFPILSIKLKQTMDKEFGNSIIVNTIKLSKNNQTNSYYHKLKKENDS